MEHSRSCKRCGTCCCNFPIYEHEAKKIKDYLIHRPDLMEKLFRNFDNNGCIFLLPGENDTWICSIYDSGARPLVCRVFGTKGLKSLACPENCFVGTKYTRKQALTLIEKNSKKSKIAGMMNDVMLPFVIKSIKETLLRELFKK